MSCHKHGYPWPSLATSPNHSSPLAGIQGYIPYPHIAAVCMFELVVLLLLGHMRGFIGVHDLWARPCFSSSVLVRLAWIVFVMGGRWPYSWCLVGCCCQDLFNIYIYMYIYKYLLTPSHKKEGTKGQFWKRNLKGLNSEFSFFQTGCPTKVKKHSLPYYSPIAEGWYYGMRLFIKGISIMWKCEQLRPEFELKSPFPFPTMISIALRARS